MTADKYIDMEERIGAEIDPNKIPPSLEDFPYYVITGMEIFNSLPDTYTGGMNSIYAGKDYSALSAMWDLYLVDEQCDRMKVFEILNLLDSRCKDQAFKAAKKAAAGKK